MKTLLSPGSTILVLGSGPIIIGQACEFDYSGTQACKALKALGYRVVLLNSNPATIMTDPDVADATYVEPLTLEFATQVIARERPNAVLPTVGGQTGLNLAIQLADSGVLEKYGCRLIGADPQAIRVAEDRDKFKAAMLEIGVNVGSSGIARTLHEAEQMLEKVGLPAIIRPSFTLGGEGGGTAWNIDEFRKIVQEGLDLSPSHEVLVERSLLGWKEFELEVMRDVADNVIIICSIENFDPMGVHTGDSITVAPAMTLTDREYQKLRDLAIKVIRKVGVETGGSNVQFAVNPDNGEVVVIELNPRVSRSSALASKATGFPIAKIAAQLAVGLTLDEIRNDITRVTPACFEPALDYVIVKFPRWNFEKFKVDDRTLGTAMKSVGEVMGIGRTFAEAFQKAVASLEGGWPDVSGWTTQRVREGVATPTPDRAACVMEGLRRGWSVEEIWRLTKIDRWFLDQLQRIIVLERQIAGFGSAALPDRLLEAKRMGFSDATLGRLVGLGRADVAKLRAEHGIRPTFKRVDTCAAEFDSFTPYLYSTWEVEDETGSSQTDRVIILGNGPNRIGQGIEFDYACCHAAFAVREMGFTSVMLNCNPETVSTDYDTSDKLYFEPCTAENVQAVVTAEQPRGTILQFGGQTPLKIAHDVGAVLGTTPDAIDLCEDRDLFSALMRRLEIRQPEGALADSVEEAWAAARKIGFPVLVRPSFVLGGRAMAICYDEADFERAVVDAVATSEMKSLLIDRFLERALEYDVDALCDGEEVHICGIIEHIEEAGVHSGDSAGVFPPVAASMSLRREMEDIVRKIALDLGVIGLINVQFAVQDDTLYVLEVNPRASRTVPFLAKATGVQYAKLATRLCLGQKLRDFGEIYRKGQDMLFVKAPVFSWRKFPDADVALGPEMRSTGEVMGVGWGFGEAYAKALIGAGMKLPTAGGVFLSVRDDAKAQIIGIGGAFRQMGFDLYATSGTAEVLRQRGIDCQAVFKVKEGRPDPVDLIKNGKIQLILNTPLGKKAFWDEGAIRKAGLRFGVPCITTVPAMKAVVAAIRSLRAGELRAIKLQEIV